MRIGEGRAPSLVLPGVLVLLPMAIIAVSVTLLQEPAGVAFGGRSLLFAAEFMMLTPVFIFGLALGAWRMLRPRQAPAMVHPSGDALPRRGTARSGGRRFEPPPWETEALPAPAALPVEDRPVQKGT